MPTLVSASDPLGPSRVSFAFAIARVLFGDGFARLVEATNEARAPVPAPAADRQVNAGYAIAKLLLGDEVDRFLDHLNEHYLRPLTQSQLSLGDNIVSALAIPGHEDLLVDLGLYGSLGAKILTRLIHRWGELHAFKINEGRRVSVAVARLAKVSGRSALVISRRAADFEQKFQSVEAKDHLASSLERAKLPETAGDFFTLVRLASRRDPQACQLLTAICTRLCDHM